jgi:hypothetical protein
VLLNQLLQRLAFGGLNKDIRIQKGMAQLFGEQYTDRAFADPRHSDQNNVFFIVR